MIRELTPIREEDFKIPTGVTSMGNYNKMPEPWKEVARDFYFNWGTMWVLNAIESRQITPQHTPELFVEGTKYAFLGIRIEWYWWGGVAVALPRKWHLEGGKTVYDGEIRYFRLGCEHNFTERRSDGMHMHYTKCTKCEQTWTYDSSG